MFIPRWSGFFSVVLLLALSTTARAQTLRPPAVPLVTFDPYLSIWSEADHLTDKNTVHWTGHEQSLASLIRIDGKTFRLMGAEPPAVPHDLDVFSRPLSYLTWQVRSTDGARHEVSIFDSTSSELAVNTPEETVVWSRTRAGPLTALRVGTAAQPVLGSSGDNHRIDWGYAYAAALTRESQSAMGGQEMLLKNFADNGRLPARDDTRMPRAVNDDMPALAFVFDLGRVGAKPVQRQVLIAYDEIYAIKYFGQNLRPYWRRNGQTPEQLLETAAKEYPSILRRCEMFDRDLMADLSAAGGERYAQICALAYRECAAACGLAADANGQPLFFTKENTSNGDIATVDVIYPMDPVW